MYISRTGKAASMEPAIGRFQLTACPPASWASPTVMGLEVCLVRQIPHRNSFQTWVNCHRLVTTNPGIDSGNIIFR